MPVMKPSFTVFMLYSAGEVTWQYPDTISVVSIVL